MGGHREVRKRAIGGTRCASSARRCGECAWLPSARIGRMHAVPGSRVIASPPPRDGRRRHPRAAGGSNRDVYDDNTHRAPGNGWSKADVWAGQEGTSGYDHRVEAHLRAHGRSHPAPKIRHHHEVREPMREQVGGWEPSTGVAGLNRRSLRPEPSSVRTRQGKPGGNHDKPSARTAVLALSRRCLTLSDASGSSALYGGAVDGV